MTTPVGGQSNISRDRNLCLAVKTANVVYPRDALKLTQRGFPAFYHVCKTIVASLQQPPVAGFMIPEKREDLQ